MQCCDANPSTGTLSFKRFFKAAAILVTYRGSLLRDMQTGQLSGTKCLSVTQTENITPQWQADSLLSIQWIAGGVELSGGLQDRMMLSPSWALRCTFCCFRRTGWAETQTNRIWVKKNFTYFNATSRQLSHWTGLGLIASSFSLILWRCEGRVAFAVLQNDFVQEAADDAAKLCRESAVSQNSFISKASCYKNKNSNTWKRDTR